MSFRGSRSRLPVVQPTTALPLLSLAALVILLKLPTLGTPAYWDEMGWASQAHWLSERNLIRALPGLRPPAVFWGHPTGLHATLATLWKVVGPSMQSAHLLIACFAALGVCSTFLLGRWLYDERTALFAALFLLLSPLYLAQSGMFLADIPVTALGVLSIYLALRGRFVTYVVCASYMVLVKETAIALVVALVLYRLLTARPFTKGVFIDAVTYSVPLFVIGAFFLLQKLTTGEFFFIYPFDIELFELSPAAVRTHFSKITRWIFLEQLRYVFTVLIVLNLILHPAARRRELILFLLILVLSGYSFSGLYFLPRYLLPVMPFFYIVAARSVMDLIRSPRLQTTANVALLGVLTWSLMAQPFRGNGEFNMRYLDVVRMHEALIGHLVVELPDARILTAWPHTPQLTSPVLGYVPRPMNAKGFTTEADLGESGEVILVSSPAGDEMDGLRTLVERNDWRLLRRLRRDAIWMELYGRPTGTARGEVE